MSAKKLKILHYVLLYCIGIIYTVEHSVTECHVGKVPNSL